MFKEHYSLITGASRGLGFSICKRLAEMESNLILISKSKLNIDKTFKSLKDSYPRIDIVPFCIDLSSQNNKEIIDSLDISDYKPDILINCAADFHYKNLIEENHLSIEEHFRLNVFSPFYLAQKLFPHMKSNNYGRIVNICSSSAYAGFPGTGIYCSSKHALLGLSRSMHNEWKNYGIRTFSISPGSIQTDMGKKVKGQRFEDFIEPNEIARYIVHLLTYNGNMNVEETRINRITYS